MRWHAAGDTMLTHAGQIIVGKAKPELGRCSPADLCCGDKTPAAAHAIYITVPDIDAAYKRAKDFGANISKEIYTNTFDRPFFKLTDPEGVKWWVALC